MSSGAVQMTMINIQPPSPQPPPISKEDLLDASMRGNWKAAKGILDKWRELIRVSINADNETTLHVAAYRGHTSFVKNLVVLMNDDDLKLASTNSNTALCVAALAGHVAVAKILVTKHNALLHIAGNQGMMPLRMAALSGKYDMVKYLYEQSIGMIGANWTNESQGSLLLACVEAEFYDVALQIVNANEELAKSGGRLLRVLARKPHGKKKLTVKEIFFFKKVKGLGGEEHQALQLFKKIWEIIEKSSSKAEIDDILRGPADKDKNLTTTGSQAATAGTAAATTPGSASVAKYSSRLLFLATEMGNAEFIYELIRKHPKRVLELNDNNQSIFHVAISHRHANIYTLLYNMGSIKELIINLEDINGNNMLHLVGILEETGMCKQFEDMSQVHVQMEEELVWFKKVSDILPPSLRIKKNEDGLSPRELFIKNHKDLVSKSQEWMKKTFSELLLLAALIITISFAAAISFASGSNQDTSDHTSLYKTTYHTFMVLNGLSFISASVAILLMLSIVSSRYAEHDFLESLPHYLNMVTMALHMSMFSMIGAFLLIIILPYCEDYPWIVYVMYAPSYIFVFASFGLLYNHRSTLFTSRYKMMLLRTN